MESQRMFICRMLICAALICHSSYSRSIFKGADLGNGVLFTWELKTSNLKISVKLPDTFKWIAVGIQGEPATLRYWEDIALISIEEEQGSEVSYLKTLHIDEDNVIYESDQDLYEWAKRGRQKSKKNYYFTIKRKLLRLPRDKPVRLIWSYGKELGLGDYPDSRKFKSVTFELDQPDSLTYALQHMYPEKQNGKETNTPVLPPADAGDATSDKKNDEKSGDLVKATESVKDKESGGSEDKGTGEEPEDTSNPKVDQSSETTTKTEGTKSEKAKEEIKTEKTTEEIKTEKAKEEIEKTMSKENTEVITKPPVLLSTVVIKQYLAVDATEDNKKVKDEEAMKPLSVTVVTEASKDVVVPDHVVTEAPKAVVVPDHVLTEAPKAVVVPDRVVTEVPKAVVVPDRVVTEAPKHVVVPEPTAANKEDVKLNTDDGGMGDEIQKGGREMPKRHRKIHPIGLGEAERKSPEGHGSCGINPCSYSRCPVGTKCFPNYVHCTSTCKKDGNSTDSTDCNCNPKKESWYDVFKNNENTVYFGVIGFSAFFTGIIVLCLACCCAKKSRKLPRPRKNKVSFYKVNDFDSSADEEIEFLKEKSEDADDEIYTKN